jgi:purine-binding chemotaxis protein CheW
MSERTPMCTFHVADLFLGIAAVQVQEVFRHREITPVPLAAPLVLGLLNLRGRVLPVLDLRRPLGRPQRSPAAPAPVHILVNTSDGPVSLLADSVGDVLEVDAADFEAPPDTLGGVARRLLRGAYKMERRLLLVPDIENTLLLADEETSAGFLASHSTPS